MRNNILIVDFILFGVVIITFKRVGHDCCVRQPTMWHTRNFLTSPDDAPEFRTENLWKIIPFSRRSLDFQSFWYVAHIFRKAAGEIISLFSKRCIFKMLIQDGLRWLVRGLVYVVVLSTNKHTIIKVFRLNEISHLEETLNCPWKVTPTNN